MCICICMCVYALLLLGDVQAVLQTTCELHHTLLTPSLEQIVPRHVSVCHVEAPTQESAGCCECSRISGLECPKIGICGACELKRVQLEPKRCLSRELSNPLLPPKSEKKGKDLGLVLFKQRTGSLGVILVDCFLLNQNSLDDFHMGRHEASGG